MKTGDRIAILGGQDVPLLSFTAHVSEVTKSNAVPTKEHLETRIALKDIRNLPKDVDLESMLRSLTIVRNLRRPFLHFRRAYRLLPADDFETIEAAEPFVSRTAFLQLLDALPQSLQIDFRIESQTDGSIGSTYHWRLQLLQAFIAERVLSVGNVLRLTRETTSKLELSDETGPIRDHFFVDEESDDKVPSPLPDSLLTQLAQFDRLSQVLASDDSPTVVALDVGFVRFLNTLSNTEFGKAEERFEQIFRKMEQ